MPARDECVGAHWKQGWGIIKVFGDGHIETDNGRPTYGDLFTEGIRPPAPIGGVQWADDGRGYMIWLIDGNTYTFGG